MPCCQDTGTPGQPPFREAGDIGAEKAWKVPHSGSKNGLCVACVQHSAAGARPEGLLEIKGKPKAGAGHLATLARMDHLLTAADSALRAVVTFCSSGSMPTMAPAPTHASSTRETSAPTRYRAGSTRTRR